MRKRSPWIPALWWFSILGTVAGVIMIAVGVNSATDAHLAGDAAGATVAAAVGGPLLTASLVGITLAILVVHQEWEAEQNRWIAEREKLAENR